MKKRKKRTILFLDRNSAFAKVTVHSTVWDNLSTNLECTFKTKPAEDDVLIDVLSDILLRLNLCPTIVQLSSILEKGNSLIL